jgi:squalene-hopene/tetraprenyl-beta-curcumene cyclase
MQIRPMLTPVLGKPTVEIRELFTGELAKFQKLEPAELRKGTKPAEIIYTAAGLAEWDRHVTGTLSKETGAALELMFRIQQKNGAWGSVDCWPPFESSAFQEATVAAMAVATAPGWRAGFKDGPLAPLQKYLRETKPPHDYGGVVLLWAATRMPDLLQKKRQQTLIKMLWSHQRDDGGWSIRTFSTPEKWGRGNRAKRLRAEPEFKNPPSDGHMTGLAVLVLREAGVPAKDARLQKAVQWLLANQRASGRWWTRSLNTDKFHYITYSGTAYPLLALMKCGALPAGLGGGR